ncbi:Dilute domain-containing protein C25B8.08, partial [Choanephora cucurbitarum]
LTLSENQGKPERDCNQKSTTHNSTIYKTSSIPIVNRFNYAAAVGDLKTLKELNNKHSINQGDNQKAGVNALMHAAYFGHLECIYFLLKQPNIRFNYQDNKGWTAFIWAVVGNHSSAIQLFFDHEAGRSLKTKDIKHALQYSMSSSITSLLNSYIEEEEKVFKNQTYNVKSNISSLNTMCYAHPPFDSHSYPSGLESQTATSKLGTSKRQFFYAESKMVGSPNLNQLNQRPIIVSKSQLQTCSNEDLEQWKIYIDKMTTFSWHQCLPDQMFVFCPDDVDTILDHALSAVYPKQLANQARDSNELWLPANVIFLSARYAHYCFSKELLHTLLSSAISKLSRIIRKCSQETQLLSFWIANISQLTIYLKKDLGLSTSTLSEQQELAEVVSKAYTSCIIEVQKKLVRVLDASIMEYTSICEQDNTEFANSWSRFLKGSSSLITRSSHEMSARSSVSEKRSSIDSLSSISTEATSFSRSTSTSLLLASPYAIGQFLSGINDMLQSYHVPSTLVIQVLAQLLHYLSCEIFNRILPNEKYLNRSRAIQIRMNVSVMEDRIHSNKLPSSFNKLLEPLLQLLQFLQCLSKLNDVFVFKSAIKKFDQLNTLQIKRCVQHYQYEVDEKRSIDHINSFFEQMLVKQRQQTTRMGLDTVTKRISRPNSIASLNFLLGEVLSMRTLSNKDLDILKNQLTEEQGLNREEKRDSTNLLPFSVATTTILLYDCKQEKCKESGQAANDDVLQYSAAIYREIKLKKQEHFDLYDKLYPAITDEWLSVLNQKLGR